MIYFMEPKNGKPKRIREDWARDFYQLWFGNNDGEMMFGRGERSYMPQSGKQYLILGEDITESEWFKRILQGKYEDGWISFHEVSNFANNWTSR